VTGSVRARAGFEAYICLNESWRRKNVPVQEIR
jgi:hypothetical protein